MRRLTVIEVTEWAALWSGPDDEGDESRDPTTLLQEGHDIHIEDVARAAEGEAVELDYVDATETAADTEVGKRGGFNAISLEKWLSLAEKK